MSDMADQGLTTEQLANPRAAAPARAADAPAAPDAARDAAPDAAREASPDARGAAREQAPDRGASQAAQLLEPQDHEAMTRRWRDIQADFVDHPREAMQDADTLVAGLMQHLAQMFSQERSQLEAQWSRGDEVSTEDLRVSLQRYRAFFERLLSV